MAEFGGTLRDAGREAVLAWSAVVAEPARFLRYGGVPMLAAIGIQLWLGISDPLPAEAGQEGGQAVLQAWVQSHAWALLAWTVFSVWGTVRLMVQTTRWAMAGENGAGMLDPAFGRRELRYAGWSVLIGMATIPAVILMSIVAATLASVGAVAFGIGSGGSEGGAAIGALLMAGIGSLIGYAAVTFVLARLLPGLVPVAFDRPAALGESWTKSGPVAGSGTALVYAVLAPVLVLSLLLGGDSLFSLPQTLLTVLGYIAYAALALAVVRFWYRAGEPGR